ncbi:MAG: hypothetical protein CL908_01995 [Deltaproteobacteria bacterium]|nr:hypothetical protein [Deltaproteobacteria bacterium]
MESSRSTADQSDLCRTKRSGVWGSTGRGKPGLDERSVSTRGFDRRRNESAFERRALFPAAGSSRTEGLQRDRDSSPALNRKRRYNPACFSGSDLARLGLTPGDRVRILSDHSEILGVVERDDGLRTGIVSMSHAWGGHSGTGSGGARNRFEYEPTHDTRRRPGPFGGSRLPRG